MSEANPVNIMGWKYPQIACYASRSADDVYAFIKALDDAFDSYKSAHPDLVSLHISKAGRTPADVPFHEGAIRYLKEKGVWTTSDQAWQDTRVARIRTVQKAWEQAAAEFAKHSPNAAGKSGDEEAWSAFWEKYRTRQT